jgi:hypothetical protein
MDVVETCLFNTNSCFYLDMLLQVVVSLLLRKTVPVMQYLQVCLLFLSPTLAEQTTRNSFS